MDEKQNQNQTPGASSPTSPAQPAQPVEDMNQPTVPTGAPNQNPDPGNQPQSAAEKSKNAGVIYLIMAIAVVGVVVVVLLMMRGGEDTTSAGPVAGIDPSQVIATVNGDEIVGSDLRTSVNQIAATAQLQGIDITDPGVQTEIQQQAVEVLINTALLEQEAAERGIEISDAEVDARIAALVQEVGNQELLEERMAALGIDDAMLVEDVRSELVIQALLEEVFAEAEITVTDEEVSAFYESSGSADELEAIRPQLEAQLEVSKEQQVLDEFIAELRTDADVELLQ